MSRCLLFICLFITVLAPFVLLPTVPAGELTIIGQTEEVVLLPQGIRLSARVDTGATTTSLDARNLVITGGTARFNLPDMYGGAEIQLPVIAEKHVRSPMGREQRPLVKLELCIGSRRLKVQANLTDRSEVRYPLIIGRNILSQGFLVDVTRANLLPPVCPSKPSE